jgi:hypothetical protein
MVSEVQVDDDRVAEELFKEQTATTNSSNSSNNSSSKVKVTATSSNNSNVVDDRWGDIYEDMPAKRKLALYDYDPVELSPNVDAEVELSFRAGDILLVCKYYFLPELFGRPSPKISDFENPSDSDSACLLVYAFIL